jgi:hypothetical protein
MERTQFIERQTRETDEGRSLTGGQEDAWGRFLQLAIDTYDFLVAAGAAPLLKLVPGANPPRHQWKRRDGRAIEFSPALVERWENWSREYAALRAGNPRFELMDMMREISESRFAESWPCGYERHIQAWVDAGDSSAPPPFDDRHGIVTAAFFNRLRELRKLCGGWLYWNDELRRIAFAPEPEWQRVRAAQEAAEAKRRKEWEESKARDERLRRRLAQIIAMARSDNTFWNALRTWELEREAKRPRDPPPPQPLPWAQSIQAVGVSPEEQAKHDNPPVDSIFAEFIARVREPDNLPTARDIVFFLRREMRQELGLDSTLQWLGGPELGRQS